MEMKDVRRSRENLKQAILEAINETPGLHYGDLAIRLNANSLELVVELCHELEAEELIQPSTKKTKRSATP